MSAELFQLDIDLLLCRYGRARVIAALASATECTEKDLLRRIASVRSKREQAVRKKQPHSLTTRVETEFRDDPELLGRLKPIAAGFDHGRVLPTLKSIRRLFESRGETSLNIRSRKSAIPALSRLLCKMSPTELNQLSSEAQRGDNDFALLSEAILNTNRRS